MATQLCATRREKLAAPLFGSSLSRSPRLLQRPGQFRHVLPPHPPALSGGWYVDIEWAHLYCARNGCWYNDNLITAYGKMVEGVYGNNTTILLPPMKTPVPKTPKKGMRVPPPTLSLITAASSGRIFLPLYINGTHWTCIVVDGSTQTVCCYDSTDKRANHNLLAQLAGEIVKKSIAKAFSVTVVPSPIQKDGDVFICLYFWRRFWKGAGSDYTEKGLLRRRWDILRTIMEFSDEIKEKEKVTE